MPVSESLAPSVLLLRTARGARGAPRCADVVRRAAGVAARAARNLALQDGLLLGMHGFLTVRLAFAPPSAMRDTAQWLASSLLGLAIVTVLLCRGEILPAGRLRAVAYRALALGSFAGTYFEMRYVLGALRSPLRDDALLAIDQQLFGLTPSVWLERFLSPTSAEWFSFFYYGYLWLVVTFLVGSAAFEPRRSRLHEILVGSAVVAVVGHVSYTLVPAVGPYATLPFVSPIPDGAWWRRCLGLVHSGGALLDVFPSLHTAFPTFFALHAFRHRRSLLFGALWPAVAFIAANMVVSTLFLRWHYAIDVVAGLLLAAVAQQAAIRSARGEAARQRAQRQPTFEPMSRTGCA